jgi:hypothetical protein
MKTDRLRERFMLLNSEYQFRTKLSLNSAQPTFKKLIEIDLLREVQKLKFVHSG